MNFPLYHLVTRLAFTLALPAILPGLLWAAPIPAGSVVGNGGSSNNQTQTQGWEFRPRVPITVTALGLHDAQLNGLADPHVIGLWTATGTLLVTETIPEGSATTLIGNFRYIDILPINLMANQNYVIGALYLGIQGGGTLDPDPADRDRFHSIQGTRTFAPEIQFINPRISSQQTSGLLFPTVMSLAGFPAIMGPNFLFEPVPEPSALALVVLNGIGAIIGSRQRKNLGAPVSG